jgi:two-component system, NarL family, sensor histidine kinase UhpB
VGPTTSRTSTARAPAAPSTAPNRRPRRAVAGTLARAPGPGSLAWRVFVTNAAILVVVGAGLILTPLTVSHPVAATEAGILVGGLALTLLVNLALVRRTFAPLERLTALMDRVDLLHPGARVDVEAATEDVQALASAFNAMLERLEGERRDSTRRAVVAQEAERLRIGRGLHDDLGQALTGVLLQLDQAVRAHPGELELEDAREAARGSLDLVRRLARDLRPDALDDLGLTSALIALCAAFTRQTGIEVEHDLPNDLPLLPREVDIVVYRVAQEALTNIARHAGATQAWLRLTHRATLALTVEDDGRGLPAGPREGTGIRGMRERAMLARGQLVTEARIGGGTRILLEIPLDHPQ